MRPNEDEVDIPVAKGSEKKANLAKDEQIKSYWDALVDDWLEFTNKVRGKRNTKH
jgi:hypothetical protein